MSENKYSVTITMRSGDRVLTQISNPGQSYAEFLNYQVAIVSGLISAGIARAEDLGDEVPEPVKAMFRGN